MRRFGLFGAVLLVLAVVYAVAWRTEPRSPQAAAQPAPQMAAVTSVTRSCPPPAPNSGAAHIAMIALPSRPAATAAAKAGFTGTGSATLSPVSATPGGSAPQPVTVSAVNALTTVTAPAATGTSGQSGTAVAATGQMAEGFEAEQADAAGMGVVSCTHPSSDMWFVGNGAGTGASGITLYLMNTGDLAASANVTLLTDAGLQTGLTTAITVAPHQVVTQRIAPFVQGSAALALHVQTSSGQVAASVWESGASGGAWLPQAAAPATSLVIPGLTVASSAARLFVTVPGATDAQAQGGGLHRPGEVHPVRHDPRGRALERDLVVRAQLPWRVGGGPAADLERADRRGGPGAGTGHGLVHHRRPAHHRAGRRGGQPGHPRAHGGPGAHRAGRRRQG